jgi:hypothetical protein
MLRLWRGYGKAMVAFDAVVQSVVVLVFEVLLACEAGSTGLWD